MSELNVEGEIWVELPNGSAIFYPGEAFTAEGGPDGEGEMWICTDDRGITYHGTVPEDYVHPSAWRVGDRLSVSAEDLPSGTQVTRNDVRLVPQRQNVNSF